MALRGALIGYGTVASQSHLPAYRELGVEIRAVADVSEARRIEAACDNPDARIYRTSEELLLREIENVDFVDICTAPLDHAPIARMALDRGYHVICATPLAVTSSAAETLMATARGRGRVLFPSHPYKHAPLVKEISGLLASEKIGEIRSIALHVLRPRHARGVTDWKPHWRRDPCLAGGGIAMDQGTHAFYLLLEWMRCDPRSISARLERRDPSFGETEDAFFAVLEFPRGHASVHLTWTSGVRKNVYLIEGTRGCVVVNGEQLELTWRKIGEPDRWRVERRAVDPRQRELGPSSWFRSVYGDFLRALDRGVFAGAEAADALKCVQLIEASYASSRDGGREVELRAEPEPLLRAM